MSRFLLDTHTWVWYVDGVDRLPARLRRLIGRSAGDCWLSPLSIWELGVLEARGRLQLAGGIRDWTERALAEFPLNEAAMVREVGTVATEIFFPHRDPVDHLLAATALVYDLTLLTLDRNLTRARGLKTRSR